MAMKKEQGRTNGRKEHNGHAHPTQIFHSTPHRLFMPALDTFYHFACERNCNWVPAGRDSDETLQKE
jgi:hypothetical protein